MKRKWKNNKIGWNENEKVIKWKWNEMKRKWKSNEMKLNENETREWNTT